MIPDLDKAYNPANHEDKIYQKWEKSGFFNPDNLDLPADAPRYTIVLPPPNITDRLHMGHAVNLAIEDLLIRYHRLRGFRTLWLPGTDHAAIATQNVVEKKILQESGRSRHDLGREKFLAEVWKFLGATQTEILHQARKLGASLDWSRLAFTLDEPRQLAVRTMFKEMYDEGVIYRGERIVNWCPRCHSTLADDEVEYKEEKAKLYWIKYGPFVLATSRPETKLGDTAVAVHPQDERYRDLVGQELMIPGVLGNFQVLVVADEAVDRDFGSGAIKVTPAHSFIDNEIAARHHLPSKKIIDEDGRMMANCGKYAGLTTAAAREAIVADMQALGLIDHIDEDYAHSAAVCYRCGTVIEPLPSKQWFISVDRKLPRLSGQSLKEKALSVAVEGRIKFIPERFSKRYQDWMLNLHDWCISRQIWFGHQIPVWYRGSETYVGVTAPDGTGWTQDPDTLDTWFSSGMWTFSTLGWPLNYQERRKSGDLAKFHPTQVLETGYEIITLWVSRMIMMSLFALDEIPFENVYLHGMLLDQNGKKMSKSKGNGVNPLDMIAKFGTDATRLAVLTGSTPGNDSRFSEDKVEIKRNFVNKLWNISRFILAAAEAKDLSLPPNKAPQPQTLADRWILANLASTMAAVDRHLADFSFSLAAEELEDFTYSKLADWYLEIAKIEKDKGEILIYILKNLLILWHPFIPFVTEAIWSSFNDSLLMVAAWPAAQIGAASAAESAELDRIIRIVQAIRNARSEHRIEPSRKLSAVIYGHEATASLEQQRDLIMNLRTGLSDLAIKPAGEKLLAAIAIPLGGIEIYLSGAVDPAKERTRLAKEETRLERLIDSQEQKLQNQDFVGRAPEKVVAAERAKLATYQIELEKIRQIIENL
ncbi:MAG: valine--tRNA ligase [Patescibacteria group bacterium]